MLDTLLFRPSVSLLKDRYVPADAAMLPTPKAATTFVDQRHFFQRFKKLSMLTISIARF